MENKTQSNSGAGSNGEVIYDKAELGELSESMQKHHDDQVKEIKQLRKDTDDIIQRVKSLPGSRETSLVITKLQEGVMWLGMRLKALNEPNPYPNSKNPENTIIEPTADGLKL